MVGQHNGPVGDRIVNQVVLPGRTRYGFKRTHGGDRVSQFLALIQWFHEVLGFVAAAAFVAMVVLVLLAFGVIDVQRKREP